MGVARGGGTGKATTEGRRHGGEAAGAKLSRAATIERLQAGTEVRTRNVLGSFFRGSLGKIPGSKEARRIGIALALRVRIPVVA